MDDFPDNEALKSRGEQVETMSGNVHVKSEQDHILFCTHSCWLAKNIVLTGKDL